MHEESKFVYRHKSIESCAVTYACMVIQQKTFVQKILSSQTSSKNMLTARVAQKASL